MYSITDYTYRQAKKIGVMVFPSERAAKKIDVYDLEGNFLASVGAKGYGDYPTFIILYGKQYANERRRLYKQRHDADRHEMYSSGWLADQLLW